MAKRTNSFNFDDTEELEYSLVISETSEEDTNEEDSNDFIRDISGLKPYDFEPEIPYVEEEIATDRHHENQSRIGNIDWCICGECKPMESETESICCLDTNEVPDELFEGEMFIVLFFLFGIYIIYSTASSKNY